MNDVWEDLIALTVIVLALAAYLVLLDSIFTNQTSRDAAAERYRRTQSLADHLASQWSYGADGGILDIAKVCTGCPPDASAAVYDMRKNQRICECGSRANGTVVRQPAAVRYGYGDVAPAMIEAAAA